MYEHVGSKIKAVIKVVIVLLFLFIGLIALLALAAIFHGAREGILVILLCVLMAIWVWISGLGFYALGQMTDNTDAMIANQEKIISLLSQTANTGSQSDSPVTPDHDLNSPEI